MLFKKILFALLIVLYIPIFVEVFYNFQVINHFYTYLEAGNRDDELNITGVAKKNLIIGDSHTGLGYYINNLRRNIPDQKFINAGVGGMGVRQLKLMARNCLKLYRPDKLVIQLYPGDDLYDIRYHLSLEKLSLTRNIYNFIYNNIFDSVWFINSHINNIKGNFDLLKVLNDKYIPTKRIDKVDVNNRKELPETMKDRSSVAPRFDEVKAMSDKVSPVKKIDTVNLNERTIWAKRMKRRSSVDPNFIENQILLKGDVYPDIYKEFINELKEIINYAVQYTSQIIILVIPDKSQISLDYQKEFRQLGFSYLHSEELLAEVDYPFIRGIQDLENNLSDINIRIINPIEEFRRIEQTENIALYLHNNTHLNDKGNKVISDLLIIELL